MAYNKIQLSSRMEMIQGDVFRLTEGTSHRCATVVEYEVLKAPVLEAKPHPNWPETIIETACVKVVNRRNGKAKSLRLKNEGECGVWRTQA